jgi:hypothetical protein
MYKIICPKKTTFAASLLEKKKTSVSANVDANETKRCAKNNLQS